MAAKQDISVPEDDLQDILSIIDLEILDQNAEFNVELDAMVANIPSDQEKAKYPCTKCNKVCLSKGGLTRHMNSKHPDHSIATSSSTGSPAVTKKPEEVLHPLYFKKYVQKSVEKLAKDGCYPAHVLDNFKNFVVTLDNVMPAYNSIKEVIVSFNGDPEKFYPEVYKQFSSDNVFPSLHVLSSRLLCFEITNHILAHLTGATVEDDAVKFENKENEFDDKEKSIIAHLSGYVFGTFYRRIRFSKRDTASLYHQQCLSFLTAGKHPDDSPSLPEHSHTDIHDRGGLWKVNKDVIDIFVVAESFFVSATKKHATKIDSKEIVATLLKNSWLLVKFSKILRSSVDEIKKEIALNLLEDLLTLYIRLRSFSYANDIKQLYKINHNKAKSKKSHRTDLKQKSSNLEYGH